MGGRGWRETIHGIDDVSGDTSRAGGRIMTDNAAILQDEGFAVRPVSPVETDAEGVEHLTASVGEEIKVGALLVRELALLLDGVHGDTDDLDVPLSDVARCRPQRLYLVTSPSGTRLRVEEHRRPGSGSGRLEVYGLAVLVGDVQGRNGFPGTGDVSAAGCASSQKEAAAEHGDEQSDLHPPSLARTDSSV